jgi:hypothetical protein
MEAVVHGATKVRTSRLLLELAMERVTATAFLTGEYRSRRIGFRREQPRSSRRKG